jgi:hypothetical protein
MAPSSRTPCGAAATIGRPPSSPRLHRGFFASSVLLVSLLLATGKIALHQEYILLCF